MLTGLPLRYAMWLALFLLFAGPTQPCGAAVVERTGHVRMRPVMTFRDGPLAASVRCGMGLSRA